MRSVLRTKLGMLAVVVGCAGAGTFVSVASSPSPTAKIAAVAYGEPQALYSFRDAEIVESSGVVASLRTDRIVFTHNDSGDTPRFFAVNDRGCTVARYKVTGAQASDWEDMAHSKDIHGKPVLWFADIGDNLGARDHVSVYRTPEPRVSPGSPGGCDPIKELTSPGQGFDLAYPDGPHDAEALMANPRTGQLYIITKSTEEGSVPTLYAAPVRLLTGKRNLMRKVTEIQIPLRTSVPTVNPIGAIPLGIIPGKQLVTGADIAPDVSRLIVRTYSDAYEWTITNGDVEGAFTRPASTVVVLPGQPQGEAIGYTREGDGFIVTSEDTVKSHPPVYLIKATSRCTSGSSALRC